MASSTSSSSASDGDRRPSGAHVDAAAAKAPHAEWAASMQAYYAACGHHYAWPAPQHLMAAAAAAAAYGAPMQFPVYHPAYYAHAPMAAGMAGESSSAAAAVAERKSERKVAGVPSGDGEDTSGSGDGESEESSEKRAADGHQKDLSSAKRRKLGDAGAQGQLSQVAITQNAMNELAFVAKVRSASKLPVPAPVKEAPHITTPNLHFGLDIWSPSPSATVASGQAAMNAGTPPLQRDDALSQMDERELKRERRKQSNRESARRSRLRKQQECEELAQKVTDLTATNSALRSELDQIKKDCEDMEAENSQLMDEMVQSEGHSALTTLSIKMEPSKAHHGSNGQLNKHRDDESKG